MANDENARENARENVREQPRPPPPNGVIGPWFWIEGGVVVLKLSPQ